MREGVLAGYPMIDVKVAIWFCHPLTPTDGIQDRCVPEGY